MPASAPRVAIDGRTLQHRPRGGIGRSLATLLPELTARARVDLLLDGRRPMVDIGAAGVSIHSARTRVSRREAAWLQLAAPRWLRGYPGVFHCPFYGLPYFQPVPMVVTIHDITFEFAPRLFSVERLVAFRAQARWAARTAARILTVSEHVRSMILDRYGKLGVSPDRVLVARQPVDPIFGPAQEDLDGRLERLGVSRPFALTLGGAARRQLPVAVAAWQLAVSELGAEPRDLPLVVVGAEEPPSVAGVKHLGPITDHELSAVFAGARCFCYATSYEGFGMPALEAAASGTPVVCARVGSLPEVLGDAAAWCDNPDAEQLGGALAGVLGDQQRQRSLAHAGAARARSVSSAAEAAEIIVGAYREAMEP